MATVLAGKTALVTGASQGLGQTFARVLAAAGATVILAARRVDRLQTLADEVVEGGGTAHALALDLTDEESVDRAVAEAIETAGRIDILVNNAGVAVNKLIRDMTAADFDLVMNTNVRGAWLMAQRTAPRMIAQGGGKIVNLSSVMADFVMPGVAAYCMTKTAMVPMTRAMALEWAKHNIQVNALAPGFVETELNAPFFASEAGQRLIRQFPGQALQQPADLGDALLFLCSTASDHVTGQVLRVDDGQALGAFRPR